MFKISIIILLTLFTSSPNAGDAAVTITLEKALEMALANNTNILRAKEKFIAVNGQIQEYRSGAFPRIDAETSYFRTYDETVEDPFYVADQVNSYSAKAVLTQTLYSGGKISAAVAAAETTLEQTEADLKIIERSIKILVYEDYYALLLAHRIVDAEIERLAQRKRHLDAAEKLLEAGAATEFEVLRARVEAANAAPLLSRAKKNVKKAEAKLKNSISMDQEISILANGGLETSRLGKINLADIIQKAVENRPEIASLKLAMKIAEKRLIAAEAEDNLNVILLAEYGWKAENLDNFGPNREAWAAGVQFSLPLFDGWSTKGKTTQASSRLRDLSLAIKQTTDSMALEARAALDDLNIADEILDAAKLTIVQAEKAVELAEIAYNNGAAAALDVSDAQLGLTAARTNYEQALYDYALAKARIQWTMNKL